MAVPGRLRQLSRRALLVELFFRRDQLERLSAIVIVMNPAERAIPNAEKFNQQLAIVCLPTATNGKHAARIVGQYLAMISEAHHTGGRGLGIPRRGQKTPHNFPPNNL